MREPELSIGQIAARTGLSVSAIRFYESKGLMHPPRTDGGQRRYPRRDLRRISFILIAQRLGFALADIAKALRGLPEGRAPTPADWEVLANGFRTELDARIAMLSALRDTLTGCIGCGCLSMTTCGLHNPTDRKAQNGPGPRSILDVASP
jgi:MerR family transcriptional regulator, redox-sensitive transcriptional activator SoxR